MIDNCVIRPARASDARQMAELYRFASEGVSDYVCSKTAGPGEDLLDVGARRYLRPEMGLHYSNCLIAERDGQVLGMMQCFPNDSALEASPDFSADDPILAPFAALDAPNTLYISGLAQYPAYRNQGLGTHFMGLAEDRCRSHDLPGLSLIAFEQNEGAVRLYNRLGFEEAARSTIVPHPLIHVTGDALLLVKML